MNTEYFLIVDTEEYAGNFEREMCAYMTGVVGECGVGQQEQEAFREDLDEETVEWFEENVGSFQDDHGCWRPVRICPTPGWFNDGIGNHYKESDCDLDEVVKQYNKTQTEYKRKHPTSTSVNLIDGPSEIRKYPAYMSFEISFYGRPPERLVNLMIERAHNACKDERVKREFCRLPETITAIRLVERNTIIQDTVLVG